MTLEEMFADAWEKTAAWCEREGKPVPAWDEIMLAEPGSSGLPVRSEGALRGLLRQRGVPPRKQNRPLIEMLYGQLVKELSGGD